MADSLSLASDIRSLNVFLFSTLAMDRAKVVDRAESKAKDCETGLSLRVIDKLVLGRLSEVVLALLSEISVARKPLSIPSKTRDGDLGSGACIRLLGEALMCLSQALQT